MKLSVADYVILIVEDLDRSLHFYTDVLGLCLGHRSGDYAQLDTGATRLGLYSRRAMAKTLGMSLKPPSHNAPGFEIGFKVPDVGEAFAELVGRGASAVMPPTDLGVSVQRMFGTLTGTLLNWHKTSVHREYSEY